MARELERERLEEDTVTNGRGKDAPSIFCGTFPLF